MNTLNNYLRKKESETVFCFLPSWDNQWMNVSRTVVFDRSPYTEAKSFHQSWRKPNHSHVYETMMVWIRVSCHVLYVICQTRKDCVWPHLKKPRQELKIRRTARNFDDTFRNGNFFWKCECLIYLIKTKTTEKSMLIMIRYPNRVTAVVAFV